MCGVLWVGGSGGGGLPCPWRRTSSQVHQGSAEGRFPERGFRSIRSLAFWWKLGTCGGLSQEEEERPAAGVLAEDRGCLASGLWS